MCFDHHRCQAVAHASCAAPSLCLACGVGCCPIMKTCERHTHLVKLVSSCELLRRSATRFQLHALHGFRTGSFLYVQGCIQVTVDVLGALRHKAPTVKTGWLAYRSHCIRYGRTCSRDGAKDGPGPGAPEFGTCSRKTRPKSVCTLSACHA